MPNLILLRHGESQWNLENRFTGWTDIDLSAHGMEEARLAGRLLAESGLALDAAFASDLKRAIRTLWIVLDQMNLMWLPYSCSWRLNERHYGVLQGLNKAETAKKFGEMQVRIWRRSYDTPPPASGAQRSPASQKRPPLRRCAGQGVARQRIPKRYPDAAHALLARVNTACLAKQSRCFDFGPRQQSQGHSETSFGGAGHGDSRPGNPHGQPVGPGTQQEVQGV